jgi:hypothetical protein
MDSDGECMDFENLSDDDDEEMEGVEFVSGMDVDDEEMPNASMSNAAVTSMPRTTPRPVPPTPQSWFSPAVTAMRMSDQSSGSDSASASSMDSDGECMDFENLSDDDDEEMEGVEFVSGMDVDDEKMSDASMPNAFHVSLNDVIVQMSLLTLSLSFSRIISNSQVRANFGSKFIESPCGRFLRRSMRRLYRD